MKKNRLHKTALSLIEVMIGIFIFTLGISAVYMVISSTLNINTYNKNFIVASNLAREQIELIRNIRDTNYELVQKWNTLNPLSKDYSVVFTGSSISFYKLENHFSAVVDSTDFPVVGSTGSYITDFKTDLLANTSAIAEYRLCLDSSGRYIYCTGLPGEKETPFYRYIEIQPLDKDNLGSSTKVANAFKVRSKVFWNQKGVHQTEIDTILTDWKRL